MVKALHAAKRGALARIDILHADLDFRRNLLLKGVYVLFLYPLSLHPLISVETVTVIPNGSTSLWINTHGGSC